MVNQDDEHRFLLQLRLQYEKDRTLFEHSSPSSKWTFIKHPNVNSKYNFIQYENDLFSNTFNIQRMLYVAYMASQSPSALMKLIVRASAKINYYEEVPTWSPGMLPYALRLLGDDTIKMTPEFDKSFSTMINDECKKIKAIETLTAISISYTFMEKQEDTLMSIVCIEIDDVLLASIGKIDKFESNITSITSVPHNAVNYNCCWTCHKIGKCQICTRCKLARYCSKECQTSDWTKTHKKYCLQITKE